MGKLRPLKGIFDFESVPEPVSGYLQRMRFPLCRPATWRPGRGFWMSFFPRGCLPPPTISGRKRPFPGAGCFHRRYGKSQKFPEKQKGGFIISRTKTFTSRTRPSDNLTYCQRIFRVLRRGQLASLPLPQFAVLPLRNLKI